ncbi:MAG: M50 family metallopeptidase [Thermosphaera sp.]
MDTLTIGLIIILIAWLVINAVFRVVKNHRAVKGLELKYGVLLILKGRLAPRPGKWFRKLNYVFTGLFIASLGLFLYFSITTVASRIWSNAPGAVLLIPGVNVRGLDVVYFVIAVSIAAITHEYFHGKTAVSNDVEVKSFGFMIALILPLAFVEVSEEKFKSSALKAKSSILAAGVAVNLLIGLAFFSLILLLSTPALYVVNVEANSIADSVGISSGDILLSVNGTKLAGFNDLRSVLSASVEGVLEFKVLKPSGEVVLKHVYKNASPIKLGVEIAETRVAAEGLTGFLGYQAGMMLLKLLSWVYLVNFNLALINAAPLFITDGGRIIYEVLGDKLGLILNSMGTLLLVLMIAPLPF